MQRILVACAILCAAIDSNAAQEEVHLPDVLFAEQFDVHLQVREPSGLMVWTRDSTLIETFGIELQVGRPLQENDIIGQIVWGRSFEANTSRPMDGKFMIINDDLVIRKGDVIQYRSSVLHKGILSHSNQHRTLVLDYIFYKPINDTCNFPCVINDQQRLHVETARLKTILEKKIMDCIGSQVSEYIFFPFPNATSYVVDTKRFVEYRLFHIDSLKPFIKNVVTTYLAPDGVGAKMQTVIDKLKVLELGKGKLDVSDFDTMLQEPEDTSVAAMEYDKETTTSSNN